jgi:hypothetical protein
MTNYPDLIPQKFMVHDDGSNAPISHQRTIASLITGLTIEYRAGRITLEPLPEIMVGEYNSPTPDVVFFDTATEEAIVIIEVCHTRGLRGDLKKVIDLIENQGYVILEGFLYNYKTNQWLRYRKGDGGQATETAYSDVLTLNLNQFL